MATNHADDWEKISEEFREAFKAHSRNQKVISEKLQKESYLRARYLRRKAAFRTTQLSLSSYKDDEHL